MTLERHRQTDRYYPIYSNMTAETPSKHHLLLALSSGILLFFASPGLSLRGVTAFFALVPLFFALRQVGNAKSGFFLGLLTGLCWYVPLLYWIVIVLGTYGYMPFYFTLPALFLLALYMSLYPAVFSALLCRPQRRHMELALLAPILWVALDFLRSFLFTGFPWQDLGYSQYLNTWFIQAADLGGHYGITFVLLLANVLFFHLAASFRRQTGRNPAFGRPRPATVAACLLLFLLFAAYNSWRWVRLDAALQKAPRQPVAVIQPNIEQDQKWRPELLLSTVQTLVKLTEEVAPEIRNGLAVWPETALPFYPPHNPLTEEFILPLLQRFDLCLLTGSPYRTIDLHNGREELFNRALLLEKNGDATQSYDKQHLVPFGEYIPLRALLPFFAPVVETMMDFSSGVNQVPISCGKLKIGVLICFESIFPELARRQVAKGATLLVNMTNDAWFGRSLAPDQHFSMSVLRAVENRRSLARSANTGISGFIDPLGRIVASSSIFEQASLAAGLPVYAGRTFFVERGFYFAPGCLLLTTLLLAANWQRRKSDKAKKESPT